MSKDSRPRKTRSAVAAILLFISAALLFLWAVDQATRAGGWLD